MADEKKTTTPAGGPQPSKRDSKPASKATKDPLDRWLDKFMASYDAEQFKDNLKRELGIRGIGPDVQAHQLRELREALRAALHADAHALYDAAQK